MGPHSRAPRLRALPPYAPYQSARHRELRDVPRGRARDAPGASGRHAQAGLVHQLSRAAAGGPRLHAVPLLRPAPMDRRRFLKVLGATSGGAAAVSACGIGPEPTEHLVPYVVPPENQVPGIATYYATTCRECAAGCGLHAKVREGRVIKLEGNPESPINQGRLCARGQAALQGLYNPDRVTDPMARGANGEWQKVTWDDAIGRLQANVREARGKGIAFVTGLESGSFGELVEAWTKLIGGRHVTYEPFAFEALRAGNRLPFGPGAIPWYDFPDARYFVSFRPGLLGTWLSPVGYQNGFTRAHAFTASRDPSMAKFVYVGPRLALTGMSADQWIAAAPG